MFIDYLTLSSSEFLNFAVIVLELSWAFLYWSMHFVSRTLVRPSSCLLPWPPAFFLFWLNLAIVWNELERLKWNYTSSFTLTGTWMLLRLWHHTAIVLLTSPSEEFVILIKMSWFSKGLGLVLIGLIHDWLFIIIVSSFYIAWVCVMQTCKDNLKNRVNICIGHAPPWFYALVSKILIVDTCADSCL